MLVMGYGRGREGMLEWMFEDFPVGHTRCLQRPLIDDGPFQKRGCNDLGKLRVGYLENGIERSTAQEASCAVYDD